MSGNDIEVSSLHIYPVKSTSNISLDTMNLGSLGPESDRRWMVVDGNGRYLTQRRFPLMCKISSRLTPDGIVISADGSEDLILTNSSYKQESDVVVWHDTVSALDCGDDAAQWLTRVLGTECRLVYMSDDCQREVDAEFASSGELVSFADGFPLLIVAESSLADLNNRLSTPIAINRFRPNIVVKGCAAFAEDGWRELRIGDVQLSIVKPCSRCVIPSIDPETGNKQSEVIKALAAYRRREGKIYFGQNALYKAEGKIRVGDPVTIIR